MINFNIRYLRNHDSLERVLDNLATKEIKSTFLIVSDWDEVCKNLLKTLESMSDKDPVATRDVFVVSTWDTPDGTQMMREALEIKSKLTRVPTLVTVKDNNVQVHLNNGDIYRELGL